MYILSEYVVWINTVELVMTVPNRYCFMDGAINVDRKFCIPAKAKNGLNSKQCNLMKLFSWKDKEVN
jgi:hypothetical protein